MCGVTNIAQIFVEVSERQPNKTAIIDAKNGRSIKFRQLNSRADGYASFFKDEGFQPGDVVILMVTPSIEFICLSLALFKLGTPIVLIDPGMGYRNLLRCIERVQPRYLVGIAKAVLFSKIFRRPFRSIRKRYCVGNSFGLFGPDLKNKHVENPSSFDVFSPKEEDLASIIFTTGSTGPPKGVRYEHSIFSAQLKLIKEYYGIGSADIDQPAFPLFALFSAAIGACSVIPDMDPTKPAKVDPEKFVGSIIQNRVTYSFGSPAIWNVVSRYCIEKSIHLQHLEKVLMAGAPVPYDLMSRVRKVLPRTASIYTPYGATESLPIVSIESREVLEDTYKKSRKGYGTCVGRPLPGIDIRIIKLSDKVIENYSDAAVISDNGIGEIIVRGEVVTRSYMNNPDETRLAKIKDGKTFWHRMGDVGYIDESGRLWFCGRRAHRVETADKTLFPIPCEAIVNEHPFVYRSALVGVKNRKGAMEPVLIVEPLKDCKDHKELLNDVKLLAEKNENTKEIIHFLIHTDFPVDIRHNAKIFREKLAIWAQKKIYS